MRATADRRGLFLGGCLGLRLHRGRGQLLGLLDGHIRLVLRLGGGLGGLVCSRLRIVAGRHGNRLPPGRPPACLH